MTSQNKGGLFLLNWLCSFFFHFFQSLRRNLFILFYMFVVAISDSRYVGTSEKKNKLETNKQTDRKKQGEGEPPRLFPVLPLLFSRAPFSFHSSQLTESLEHAILWIIYCDVLFKRKPLIRMPISSLFSSLS